MITVIDPRRSLEWPARALATSLTAISTHADARLRRGTKGGSNAAMAQSDLYMTHAPPLPARGRGASPRPPPPPRAPAMAPVPAAAVPAMAPVPAMAAVRESMPSLIPLDDAADTGLLTLSPEFLDALRKVAPKRRRVKIRYVVGLGLAVVAVVLAADASMRDFVAARWHRGGGDAPRAIAAEQAMKPATTALAVEQPIAATNTPVADPIAVSPANPPDAKKTRPRRAMPRAKGKHTNPATGQAPDESIRGL